MKLPFKPAAVLLPLSLFLSSCATQPVSQTAPAAPVAQPSPTPDHKARRIIVFIPVSEADAVAALKLFDRFPSLRMTIAMSPRFQRFAKEPLLKSEALTLIKAGRLELGLQLPNAPLIPLLIDTNSAKDSLPPGTPLPNPAFAYPDDVIQIVARAKTDFFHTWNALPHGMTLPYGATSPGLIALFDRLGFSWLIGALGAPAIGAPYLSGSLRIWDATPEGKAAGTSLLVCDEHNTSSERAMQRLAEWAQAVQTPALPSDTDVTPQPLPAGTSWARRTWNSPDWSVGIGQSRKNAAWGWLRRTREDLEVYKNSGRASVQRLDLAFEEIYTAENFNFFTAIGLATSASDDREHEYQATLSSVYRLINQTPPDDLFSESAAGSAAAPRVSSTTVLAESLPDGNLHLAFGDPAGDDRGDGKLASPPNPGSPGGFDLRQFEVLTTSQSIIFSVTLGAPDAPLLADIYMDLNGQPNLGTVTMLPGRGLTTAPSDAWEYAISMTGTQAFLYRTRNGGTYEQSGTFPAIRDGNKLRVMLPRSTIHGNPKNWGYQVLVMAADPASKPSSPMPWTSPDAKAPPVYDLLDPLDVTQSQLLSDVASGVRSDLPFVRVQQ